MKYNIKIDDFEGPLDLLLHLIKEANIDIYDISIDEITSQYLDYINAMESLDIEVDSVYLVMAAELMLIKSKSLLPNNESEQDDDEVEEELTKESLITRLVEYEKYKELTKNFKVLELDRKNLYTKAPSNLNDITNEKFVNDSDIGLDDLVSAFEKFLIRKDMEKPLNTKITNKEYSVRKRKSDIKNYLLKNKCAEFTELFDVYNKSYIVVTFMSILELAKEEEVNLRQNCNFDKIYIELKNNEACY